MTRIMHKTLLAVAISVLACGSQPLLAQAKTNEQLSSEINAVQQNLASIQQEMQGLRRLLDNRAMLELFQRMDDLASEVSQLRGQIEEQNHDLAGLKKRQRELYLDIDRRLRELEITSTRAPVAVVTPPVISEQAPPASKTPPTDASPEVKVPAVAAPDTAPVVAASQPEASEPAADVGAAQQPVSVERAEYQKAFDMLKEGRYKMANASFREFLEKYPQSSYAGNAQYWLGESNYVTRDFEDAIKEFQAVTTRYPTSNKVPDAMLKLGYTYYELRQFNSARAILDQLQKQYPNTTHARLAGKRLARMEREGH